ncbi:MAG: ferredoxin oxidoreductase [Deltaproteobacteria bacterium CG11_big_fil_rev_8_21_14_0_20_45_16]|nr:MAG: ferredoxin oxidoreductase [Deltaproteobacteria bacterium CG11_big_fil_rev_8_21_14_0_20_45_16]
MTSKINDFSISVATVNGSGSQSSNQVLIRSIFRMGIPVSGKNLFPSNIQGLPTWFTIRVNENSWTARHTQNDILVCMNEGTYLEDVKSAAAQSIIIHHDHMKVAEIRKDVRSISVPFKDLVAKACPEAKLRKLTVNMIYVGIVAELVGIEESAIDEALDQQFRAKSKVITLNKDAINAGREFIRQTQPNFKSPCQVQRRNETKNKILIEGNAASAIGAIFAGCQLFSWYPITPSSSVAEYFSQYADKYRLDKDGKKTFAVVQAEDELAAIGMVLGASWMGIRAMTATSGPGISLMAEFTGYAYFTETPAVVFDIQRVGPSTGLPTRTSQGDILFVANLSHGDTKIVCLYPGTVEECYSFAYQAFDLAEQLQWPIYLMSDLDLGMNLWMSDPLKYIDKPLQRGKVLHDKDFERIEKFGRYQDTDNDGICYRTLPGLKDRRGVFFTRGSGHNEQAQYTESGEAYVRMMNRLNKKWDSAREYLPSSVLEYQSGSRLGVIAYGSSHDAMRESVHELKQNGIDLDYLRLRAYPFDSKLEDFLKDHDQIFIVDQNRDGQMRALISQDSKYAAHISKLESLLYYDGLPLAASSITLDIIERVNRSVAKVG